MKRVHNLEIECLLQINKSKKQCLNQHLDLRLNIINEFSIILNSRDFVDKTLIDDFLKSILLDVSIAKIKTALEEVKIYYNKEKLKEKNVNKDIKKDKFMLAWMLNIIKNSIRAYEIYFKEKDLPFIKKCLEQVSTSEISLAAVKRYGTLLEYAKIQSKEICIEAIENNYFALEFVSNQTDEICLLLC